MLTILWFMLAALIIAKAALHMRDWVPKKDCDLDQQIYRLKQVVATARELDTYWEIRAMAQRAKP
jgi:hypothetical protein